MSRDYTEITDEQLRTINKRAIEQPSYDALREQNRVLREALRQALDDIPGWVMLASDALTATSQPGGTHEL